MRIAKPLCIFFAISCSSAPQPSPAPIASQPPEAEIDDGTPVEPPVVADAGPDPQAASRTTPCAADSPEHRDATSKLLVLQGEMNNLKSDDDHTVTAEKLDELIAHPCLELARSIRNVPENRPTAAAALIEFWNDGGSTWLWNEVNRATARQIVLPPQFRSVLSRELNSKSVLAPLLCGQKDSKCGASSRGWAHRAMVALQAEKDVDANKAKTIEESRKECVVEAMKQPETLRFSRWHACVDALRPRRESLPLWLPRSPRSGWLVVRGRRGHYSFCDGVALFDLATGASYSMRSCSGLALTSSGRVNQKATDAKRAREFRRGKVNVENLRETLWMLLLLESVEEERETTYIDIPEQINAVANDQGFIGSMTGSYMSSSAQTTLFWRYVAGETAELAGTVRWPSDYNSAASTHAVELLRVTEAAFVAGCPKARLPRLKKTKKGTGVSGVDADPNRLALLQSDMFADLKKRATTRCRR